MTVLNVVNHVDIEEKKNVCIHGAAGPFSLLAEGLQLRGKDHGNSFSGQILCNCCVQKIKTANTCSNAEHNMCTRSICLKERQFEAVFLNVSRHLQNEQQNFWSSKKFFVRWWILIIMLSSGISFPPLSFSNKQLKNRIVALWNAFFKQTILTPTQIRNCGGQNRRQHLAPLSLQKRTNSFWAISPPWFSVFLKASANRCRWGPHHQSRLQL